MPNLERSNAESGVTLACTGTYWCGPEERECAEACVVECI